jgi:hypothetical protein
LYKTEQFSENIEETIQAGRPVMTPKMVSEMNA